MRRTAKNLADTFEPALVARRGKVLNLRCNSLREAVALERELRTRGWNATITKTIDLATAKAWNAVRCTGHQKKRKA